MENFPATLVLGCFQESKVTKTGDQVYLSGTTVWPRHREEAGKRPSWNSKFVGWGCGWRCPGKTWPSHGVSPGQPQLRGTLQPIPVQLHPGHLPQALSLPLPGWLVIHIHANLKTSVWGRWQSPWKHTEKVLAWLLAPCYCALKHPFLKAPLHPNKTLEHLCSTLIIITCL